MARVAACLLQASVLLLMAPLAYTTLVSSHVFSNHKGGCGKTTLLFHCAGEYSKRHPDEKVLVMDVTLRGDLSELLLGGDKGGAGKAAVRAVAPSRSTTKLFQLAVAASAAPGAADSQSRLNAYVSKLLKEDGADHSGEFDVEHHAIRVQDLNPSLPGNIYLCPGGSGPQTSYPHQERWAIAETLRKALEKSPDRWKILCDSDGDQGFSDYSKIAHALCDGVIIPLKTNVNDFSNRVVPMMEELFQLKGKGEARSCVQMIVWNEVDVQKNVPSKVSGSLTPPKAAQGVIGMLNELVAEVAAAYPALFYNTAPQDRDQILEFCGATTMCMRDFGVTGMAASEHGLPFCTLKPGKLEGGRITYDIAQDTLMSLSANVAELADRMNDPPWGQ